jgi:hypothetical protein
MVNLKDEKIQLKALEDLFQQKRFSDALGIANKLKDEFPNSYQIRLLHVKTLKALNKLPEAEEALADLMNRFPNNINLLLEMGELNTVQRKYDEAIEYYNRILFLDPFNTQAKESIDQINNRRKNGLSGSSQGFGSSPEVVSYTSDSLQNADTLHEFEPVSLGEPDTKKMELPDFMEIPAEPELPEIPEIPDELSPPEPPVQEEREAERSLNYDFLEDGIDTEVPESAPEPTFEEQEFNHTLSREPQEELFGETESQVVKPPELPEIPEIPDSPVEFKLDIPDSISPDIEEKPLPEPPTPVSMSKQEPIFPDMEFPELPEVEDGELPDEKERQAADSFFPPAPPPRPDVDNMPDIDEFIGAEKPPEDSDKLQSDAFAPSFAEETPELPEFETPAPVFADESPELPEEETLPPVFADESPELPEEETLPPVFADESPELPEEETLPPAFAEETPELPEETLPSVFADESPELPEEETLPSVFADESPELPEEETLPSVFADESPELPEETLPPAFAEKTPELPEETLPPAFAEETPEFTEKTPPPAAFAEETPDPWSEVPDTPFVEETPELPEEDAPPPVFTEVTPEQWPDTSETQFEEETPELPEVETPVPAFVQEEPELRQEDESIKFTEPPVMARYKSAAAAAEIDENTEFVTESAAELYMNQGLLDDAQSIYEKLYRQKNDNRFLDRIFLVKQLKVKQHTIQRLTKFLQLVNRKYKGD